MKRAPSELLALICAIADQASANATMLENSKEGMFPATEEEYMMQLDDLFAVVDQLQNIIKVNRDPLASEELLDWMNGDDSPIEDYFQSM